MNLRNICLLTLVSLFSIVPSVRAIDPFLTTAVISGALAATGFGAGAVAKMRHKKKLEYFRKKGIVAASSSPVVTALHFTAGSLAGLAVLAGGVCGVRKWQEGRDTSKGGASTALDDNVLAAHAAKEKKPFLKATVIRGSTVACMGRQEQNNKKIREEARKDHRAAAISDTWRVLRNPKTFTFAQILDGCEPSDLAKAITGVYQVAESLFERSTSLDKKAKAKDNRRLKKKLSDDARRLSKQGSQLHLFCATHAGDEQLAQGIA